MCAYASVSCRKTGREGVEGEEQDEEEEEEQLNLVGVSFPVSLLLIHLSLLRLLSFLSSLVPSLPLLLVW